MEEGDCNFYFSNYEAFLYHLGQDHISVYNEFEDKSIILDLSGKLTWQAIVILDFFRVNKKVIEDMNLKLVYLTSDE